VKSEVVGKCLVISQRKPPVEVGKMCYRDICKGLSSVEPPELLYRCGKRDVNM